MVGKASWWRNFLGRRVGRQAGDPPRPANAVRLSEVFVSYGDQELSGLFTGSAPVYAAISLRSDAVGRPPLHLRRLGSRDVVEEGAHPVYRFLRDPAKALHRAGLMRLTEAYLNMWGVAYWVLEYLPDPRIRLLEPWKTGRMVARTGELEGFTYVGPMGPVSYPLDKVVYFRSMSPEDPLGGVGGLSTARVPVEGAMLAGEYNREFFQNQARPDLILTSPETMTDATVRRFYEGWDERHRGPGKAHRPALASLVNGVYPLGARHVDMDFVNALRWSLEEVSRAFGVPKTLLAELERATFSNFIASERMFWRNTIVPRLRYIEEELNQQMLPKLGIGEVFFQFDLGAIEALVDETHEAARRDAVLLENGVLTINEVRRRRGLGSVPWGDVPWERNRVDGNRERGYGADVNDADEKVLRIA